MTKPAACSEMSDAVFVEAIETAVELREESARKKRAMEKRRFLGRRAILAQDPEDSPKKEEEHCKLNPRVSGSCKGERNESLERLKAFLDAYRDAWKRFKEGLRDVVFPAGTYALRVHLGVACESPP
jgi:putative transposase